ncbi:unnamed protein product, partial [Ectocarpus sp. 8 AP-2014]
MLHIGFLKLVASRCLSGGTARTRLLLASKRAASACSPWAYHRRGPRRSLPRLGLMVVRHVRYNVPCSGSAFARIGRLASRMVVEQQSAGAHDGGAEQYCSASYPAVKSTAIFFVCSSEQGDGAFRPCSFFSCKSLERNSLGRGEETSYPSTEWC